MPDALIGCGRETGIRTLGTLAGTTDFESVPFDHSGTSPHVKFASKSMSHIKRILKCNSKSIEFERV